MMDRFIDAAVEQFAHDDNRAIVAFNQLVQSDPRAENVCLTIRDGMMPAWKRK